MKKDDIIITLHPGIGEDPDEYLAEFIPMAKQHGLDPNQNPHIKITVMRPTILYLCGVRH